MILDRRRDKSSHDIPHLHITGNKAGLVVNAYYVKSHISTPYRDN